MRQALPIAAAVAALALAGCGSGSSTSMSPTQRTPTTRAGAAAAKRARAQARAAEAKAPKGASPTLRAIYRQFRPPAPDPEARGSAAAIKAGERACAHKTPLEVKEELYAAARPHLSPEQAKMIGGIDHYERTAPHDQSFVAGQLAADVYEATLAAPVAQFGYQGCVYSLARGLEGRLAP